MEHWKLTKNTYEQAAIHGADILRTGGVIIYPTDTLYGLGADVQKSEAVARVMDIKGVERRHPFLVAVADIRMAKRYVFWPDAAEKIAQAFLPGALSLVLPAREGVSWAALDGTIGIRIPNHPFSLALTHALDSPIVSTSVNKTGAQPLCNPAQLIEVLGPGIELVSCIFDAGICPPMLPSTIVQVQKDNTWRVVRVGAIPEDAIRSVVI